MDPESTGKITKSTLLTSLSSTSATTSQSGRYTYDQIRETLKSVNLDSSGSIELEDFVSLVSKLKAGGGEDAVKVIRGGTLGGLVGGVGGIKLSSSSGASSSGAGGAGGGGSPAASSGGKVLVKGSNTNITHSINEDERTEFTRHINQVSQSLFVVFLLSFSLVLVLIYLFVTYSIRY